MPARPLESGAWPVTNSANVSLAFNPNTFAGIAFLWFIGCYVTGLVSSKTEFLCHDVLRKRSLVFGPTVCRDIGGMGRDLCFDTRCPKDDYLDARKHREVVKKAEDAKRRHAKSPSRQVLDRFGEL